MLIINNLLLQIGRSILGLYFVLPGFMKIIYWDAHVELMTAHGMKLIPYLLATAMVVEVVFGGMLIFNYKTFYSGIILACLVVLINFNLHDFWNYSGGTGAHELQNFIKNTAILGGLLVLSAGDLSTHNDSFKAS